MEKISFVILTWNSEKVIGSCLTSIAEIKDQKTEIILVDNGSVDNTSAVITTFRNNNPEISMIEIRLGRNFGTTISRNIGLDKVSEDADYICILDSDTVINQSAVTELISNLNNDPQNALAGPHMVNLEGVDQVTAKRIPTAMLKIRKAIPIRSIQKIGERQEKYDFTGDHRNYPVGYLISACWLMRKDLISKIGLLDEKIFYSPEDVEYCVRVWSNGYRVIYCPNAHIIHATQRISKKKLVSKHNFEHIKGLIYFFRKYGLFFSADKIICK